MEKPQLRLGFLVGSCVTMKKLMSFLSRWFLTSKTFVYTHQLVIVFLFLAACAVGVMWPQFAHTGPALIDDGADLLQAKRLSLPNIIAVEILSSQRTWPLRLVVRELLYSAFGTDIGKHFMVMSGLLATTLWCVFMLVRRVKLNSWWAMIPAVLLLLSPALYDNYYRLGTGEPLQFLLFLLSLLALEYGWYWTAVAVMVVNLFSKETSVFYSLVCIAELLYLKKKQQFMVGSFAVVSFTLVLLYKLLTVGGTYVARAGFDLGVVVMSLSPNTLTFRLLALIFVLVVFIQKHDRARIRLLVSYFLTFIPLFLWPTNQFYYLLLNHGMALVCSVVFFHDILDDHSLLKKAIGILGMFLFVGSIVWPSIFFSVFTIQRWYQEYATGGALANYLLTTDLADKDVYVSVPDFERHDKIFIYLHYWKEGPRSFIPDNRQWSRVEGKAQQRMMIAQEVQQEFLVAQSPNRLLITTTTNSALSSSDFERTDFCAIRPFGRKQCGFYIYQPVVNESE